MGEWTPEGAAERLAIAKQRLDEGFGEGEGVDAARNAFLRWAMSLAPADLIEALAHIATLTAQAQAWEQERAAYRAMLCNPLALWLPPDAVTTALEWMTQQEIPCSCGGGKIEWDTNAWVHEDDCDIGLSEHAAATLGYWAEFMAAREKVITAAGRPTAREGA